MGTAWRGVVRLKNRKGEPSRAVRITFEGCTLPTEVWIACTPHQVSAFAGSVRRCTKCQVIGHTKSQCRSRVTRCSRCGAGGHAAEGCGNTLSRKKPLQPIAETAPHDLFWREEPAVSRTFEPPKCSYADAAGNKVQTCMPAIQKKATTLAARALKTKAQITQIQTNIETLRLSRLEQKLIE